jgi:hypothetical protein
MAKNNMKINFLYFFLLFFSLFIHCSMIHLKGSNKRGLELTIEKKDIHLSMIQNKDNNKADVTDNINILYYSKREGCNENNCHSPYGKCSSKDTCGCLPGYAPNPRGEDVQCSYLLKEQYIFFLLEILIPIGVGHLYTGRILYGLIKAIYVIGVIIIGCFIKTPSKAATTTSRRVFQFLTYILYLSVLFWQVFDISMIGLNRFKDGKGLYPTVWVMK